MGGVLLTCLRGGGITCPGGPGVFYPQWGGSVKVLTCPGGRGGGSDSMCVLGVEGSGEKMRAPEDNFWNSPKTVHCFICPRIASKRGEKNCPPPKQAASPHHFRISDAKPSPFFFGGGADSWPVYFTSAAKCFAFWTG